MLLLIIDYIWGRLLPMDDRIDALLSDIEASEAARQAHLRRGEFGDEFVAHAAERTMLERLRGSLGSSVRVRADSREVTGTAAFLGAGIIVITAAETSIVAIEHIREVRTHARHHRFEPDRLERLGLGSALRRLAAAYDEITVAIGGRSSVIRGRSTMVAADYVEIAGRVIPFSAIVMVQARVNPFA